MAVIRVEVEVDSDVYPELYAGLRAIERPEACAERLRQLAASGLVWEGVRMRGPAADVAPQRPSRAANVPVLFDVIEEPQVQEAEQELAPPLPPPLDTGVYRPGARSERVRRMRDRGLFKNG